MTSWRIHRLMIGFTQAEVATRSRINPTRLSAIERGLRKPLPDERDRLTRTLARLGRKPRQNRRLLNELSMLTATSDQ